MTVDCYHCPESASHETDEAEGRILSQSELSWFFVRSGWVALSEAYWVCPGCAQVCGWSMSVVKGKDEDHYLIVDVNRVVYATVFYSRDEGRWLATFRALSVAQISEVQRVVQAQSEVAKL